MSIASTSLSEDSGFSSLGMIHAFSGLGPPVSNLIYSSSLNACGSEEDYATEDVNVLIDEETKGEKNWCTTVFLWVGLLVIVVNVILFFLVGRGIQKMKIAVKYETEKTN